MFTHIKAHTYTDRKINEDAYSYNKDYLLVLDGATGLGNNNIMNMEDDAAWFTKRLNEEISSHIYDGSLSDIVSNAIHTIQNEYVLDVDTMDEIDMPSSCIALFRIQNDTLEYFGFGDTIGVVELTNGEIEIFCDQNIEKLDNQAISKMISLSQNLNIPFLQTRSMIQEDLIINRKKRNKENGYYNLDLSQKWKHHEMHKEWKLQDVSRVACMSDGFWQVLSYPIYKDMKDLLEAIEKDELEVFKKLYQAQEEDYTCEKVHRLKKRDDTTLVFSTIEQK